MPPSRQAADAALAQEESLLYGTLLMLNAPSWEGAKFIDFSPAMFRKQNAKAVEAILFHCHGCIHGKAAAKKAFKGLWPLIDKDRKQQKDYYQKVVEWLKELKDQGQLDVYTPTISSVLRAAAGPKLVALLLDLTTLALLREHSRAFPEDDLLLPGMADQRLVRELALPLAAVSRAALQLEAQQFLELLGEGAALAAASEATAGQLQAEYYQLTAQQVQLQAAHEAAGLPPLLPQPTPAADALHLALEQAAAGGMPVLNNTDTNMTSSSNCNALEAVLGGVQPLPSSQEAGEGALLQQAAHLWQGLEGQLGRYSELQALVEGVLRFEAHPHAIDGAQLAAAAGLEGDEGAGVPADVDILALLQSWLGDLQQLSSSIHTLAGAPPAPPGASAISSSSSSSSGGPGRREAGQGQPTPLLPSAVASSHAPHLSAQLGAHGGCLEGLRALRSQAAAQLATTESHVAQLEPRVYGAMASLELSQQEGPLIADLLADLSLVGASVPGGTGAPGEDGRQSAAAAEGAGPEGPAASMGVGAGRAPLQLVPPTPVLQQLLLKQQARQQYQQEVSLAEGVPQPHVQPLDLSPAAEGPGSQGHGPSHLVPPLPLSGGGLLSAAAESLDEGGDPQLGLELMSPELMDIDLVASDEDEFDQDVDLDLGSDSQGCASPVAFPGWQEPAAADCSSGGRSKDGVKRVSLGLDLGAALAGSPAGNDQLLGSGSSSGVHGFADIASSPNLSFAPPPEFAPGAFAAALAAAATQDSPAEGEDTPPRIGKGDGTSRRRGGGGLALPRLSLQGWAALSAPVGQPAAASPLLSNSMAAAADTDQAAGAAAAAGAATAGAAAADAARGGSGDVLAAALALGSPVEAGGAVAEPDAWPCGQEAVSAAGAELDVVAVPGGSGTEPEEVWPHPAAIAAGGGSCGGEAGDEVGSLGARSPTPGDQQLPDPFASAHLEGGEPFSELHPRRLTFSALPPDTQLPGWARARSRRPAAAGAALAAVAGGAAAGAAAVGAAEPVGVSSSTDGPPAAEAVQEGLGDAVGHPAPEAGGGGGLSALRARFAQLKGA